MKLGSVSISYAIVCVWHSQSSSGPHWYHHLQLLPFCDVLGGFLEAAYSKLALTKQVLTHDRTVPAH